MATLERHGPMGVDLVFLDDTRGPLSVGKSADNHLVIDGDEAISRLHARLERLGPGWCITDLESSNGTFVNGKRITSCKLWSGDEIRLGRTRLILRDSNARRADGTTKPVRERPTLTKTEFLVLVELCRPLLSGHTFTQPASVEQIARALGVKRPAIQMHLSNLYDKFGMFPEEGKSRRVLLANAAIECGAVSRKDLEAGGGDRI
jgi:pSer/pThr/pTyr-binding forkhead associated (FHA) protein